MQKWMMTCYIEKGVNFTITENDSVYVGNLSH